MLPAVKIMFRRNFHWLFLLTLAGTISVTQGQTSPANPETGKPRMVILGASYAAGLKQPALAGYTVMNRGIGGEETGQMLARFERDVIAAAPAAVLIWGTINNIHRAPPGPIDAVHRRVKADYEQMVSLATAKGIKVILATEITLTEAVGWKNKFAAWVGGLRGKEGYSARVNKEVRALNGWLRSYARQKGLQVLDFEQVLDDGEGFRKEEYTSEDGSHVNAEGYAALTAYMVAQLPR